MLDQVSISCSVDNKRIRGITFGSNFERAIIMDGEVEISKLVDISESAMAESEAEIKSEAQLSSRRGDINYDQLSYHSGSKMPDPREKYAFYLNYFSMELKDTKFIRKKKTKLNIEECKVRTSLNDNFKYQEINLYEFGKHVIGLKATFDEYLG